MQAEVYTDDGGPLLNTGALWLGIIVAVIIFIWSLYKVRDAYRRKDILSIVTMYLGPILALLAFALTLTLIWNGLGWTNGINPPTKVLDSAYIGWWTDYPVLIICFVIPMCLGLPAMAIWSYSNNVKMQILAMFMYVFYGWFVASCIVGVNAGMGAVH